MVIPKLEALGKNLAFVDENDEGFYGCQTTQDKESRTFERGNRIAAEIAAQMILNIERQKNNKVHTGVI